MYVPKHFVPEDKATAWGLIDAAPFATLISPAAEPWISHLPLIRDAERLFGHMSRRNLHWQILEKAPQVTAIFHGPNTYITPNWYAEHDVPTWNYAVVHVRGTVRLLENARDLTKILVRLTDRFETGPDAWRFGLPEDLKGEGELAAAIIGFEIVDLTLEAKFKLGQNRKPEDRDGVRQGLAQRDDDGSRGVLALMRSLKV